MKIFLSITILMFSAISFASGGEAHHDEGIPSIVWWQLANVVVLVGGMYYFLKDGAKEFFKNKKESFEAHAKKSLAIKQDAEAQYADIKNRLDQLTLSADESISRAKAEAVDLRKQILAEAEAIAKKLKEDAQKTAEIEATKASLKLRDQLIQDAISAANNILTKDISSGDHKKLQTEFVEHVGAVK